MPTTPRTRRKFVALLTLALRPGTPGEATAAWLAVAREGARLAYPLDTLYDAHKATLVDELGIWPLVVDAYYDVAGVA
jgi:hypothetical protein